MAKFTITRDDSGKHTWMAKGTNSRTGKKIMSRGGQKGTPVGKRNPDSEQSFDARHEATVMAPKKYINRLRWDNKAKLGTSILIPDELFAEAGSSETPAKTAAPKKAGAKKRGSEKGPRKERV